MSQVSHATSEADRVSWLQLVAYGSGGLIPIALFNIAGQLVGLLGNISLGLSAFWLGAILMFPRLWDAVSDPVMGYLTDHTHTRWGRRRPYLLLGGLLVAVSFVGMWWIPSHESVHSIFASEQTYQWFQLAFILGGVLVFYTSCTIFEIPHGALGMEMSPDYHERTRLFSAKSFLGNLFAMGTPWLLWLAARDVFSGPGGTPADGMRYVSLLVAAILIPLAFWWFRTLHEPEFAEFRERPKSSFWVDMARTLENRTFLRLTLAIFALSMGFNFVGNLNNYITIFYVFGGDESAATFVLGINGTTWAIVALAAVLPLNLISRRLGKHRTLLVAIGLMSAAQLSKIVCYDPANPWLLLIPTALLSMGMLMFYTLAASMIADVCDADELATGQRAEGTYYSVFWWLLKMGSAVASLVGGALLVYTQFNESQNVTVGKLLSRIATLEASAEAWDEKETPLSERQTAVEDGLRSISEQLDVVAERFAERSDEGRMPDAEHAAQLASRLAAVRTRVNVFTQESEALAEAPETLKEAAAELLIEARPLKAQSPQTLYRLRLLEIGLPLLLSIVSVALLIGYPLTEARCYEIKAALEERNRAAEA